MLIGQPRGPYEPNSISGRKDVAENQADALTYGVSQCPISSSSMMVYRGNSLFEMVAIIMCNEGIVKML